MFDFSNKSPFSDWIAAAFGYHTAGMGIFVFSLVIYLIVFYWMPVYLIETMSRKSAASIEMRLGPNRIRGNGIFQGLADFFEIFF
jgi:NADH:ubiquinone oxidoreductase subunit H